MNIFNKIPKILKGNKVIWLVAILLMVISSIAVFSSSVNLFGESTSTKHLLGILSAFALMLATVWIPTKYYRKLVIFGYFLSIFLLILTLIIAPEINGAKRWLFIGPISFQPSDFAKIALMGYLANILSFKDESYSSFGQYLKIFIPIGVIFLLIFTQNLSTGLLIVFSSMILLFFTRVKPLYFWGTVGIATVCVGLFLAVVVMGDIQWGRFPTWKQRILSHTEENVEDYQQVKNARLAIASGGFRGVGFGRGAQKGRLSNIQSDYIFTNIAEEGGMWLSFIVMALYLFFFTQSMKIAKSINQKQEDGQLDSKYKFRQYLVVGLSIEIIVQALAHIAVSLDITPVTGQPLPLVSSGISSLWGTGIAIGAILGISREFSSDSDKEEKEEEPAEIEVAEQSEQEDMQEESGAEVLHEVFEEEVVVNNNTEI